MSAGALRPQNVVPAAITRGSKPVLNTLQTERGIRIDVDRSRDRLLTDFGKATLDDRYLLPGESYQDLFARVASHYADDTAHAQRIYSYMSKLWRSEERRVGKECVSTCRSRWSPYP